MIEHNWVCVTTRSTEKYFQKETLSHFGYDPFRLSREIHPEVLAISGWLVSKHWPLKGPIDEMMIHVKEGGLIDQMEKRTNPTWMPKPPIEKLLPIDIQHLVGGILMYAFGLSTALASFIVEIIRFKIRKTVHGSQKHSHIKHRQ